MTPESLYWRGLSYCHIDFTAAPIYIHPLYSYDCFGYDNVTMPVQCGSWGVILVSL